MFGSKGAAGPLLPDPNPQWTDILEARRQRGFQIRTSFIPNEITPRVIDPGDGSDVLPKHSLFDTKHESVRNPHNRLREIQDATCSEPIPVVSAHEPVPLIFQNAWRKLSWMHKS